jgi:hypothetical protein
MIFDEYFLKYQNIFDFVTEKCDQTQFSGQIFLFFNFQGLPKKMARGDSLHIP